MDPLEIMRRLPAKRCDAIVVPLLFAVCVCKHRRRIVAEEEEEKEEEARVAAVHLAENYGNNNFVLTLPVSPSSFYFPTPVGRHCKPEVRAVATGIARPKLRNSFGNRSSDSSKA